LEKIILSQFLALSLYAAFVGFCFCDGFRLRTARKLIWFATFLAAVFVVMKTRGQLDLSLILPLPTLLAIALGAFQIRSSRGDRR
jgi:hypothetical protein